MNRVDTKLIHSGGDYFVGSSRNGTKRHNRNGINVWIVPLRKSCTVRAKAEQRERGRKKSYFAENSVDQVRERERGGRRRLWCYGHECEIAFVMPTTTLVHGKAALAGQSQFGSSRKNREINFRYETPENHFLLLFKRFTQVIFASIHSEKSSRREDEEDGRVSSVYEMCVFSFDKYTQNADRFSLQHSVVIYSSFRIRPQATQSTHNAYQ